MTEVREAKLSQRWVAALGAVGVVFGDIGTSPLYTLQVAAKGDAGGRLDRPDTLGVVSLILWALLLAVSVKYVGFVMRADNRGEGGIFALLSRLPRRSRTTMGIMALSVVAGAALLFGDGMITPAISVLSALEGLEIAAPGMRRFIVPLTCGVLFGLFAIQGRGTARVGALFGPVMVAWFVTVGALGLREVLRAPGILTALSPHWGVLYFAHHGLRGLSILGVVVLAITGGEALYADMGHFGASPIRWSWFGLVFPSLAFSYLGQAALVLRKPEALAHPFFSMVPAGIFTVGLVALAAMATTIASQAMISGVFSLTQQAVQLGYFPRVTVRHTSREAEGQIYVPLMNWGLMVACMALVMGFRESSHLASAYGIAVSGTMAITSVVFFDVTRSAWKWPPVRSVPLLCLFLAFDLPFFFANLTKVIDGGYVPILVGMVFFLIMVNWRRGRTLLGEYMRRRCVPLDEFLARLPESGVARMPGTAIYLTATEGVPHVLSIQASRIRSIMEHVIVLRVVVGHEPQALEGQRDEVEPFDRHGFVRVSIRFGYTEKPEVPPALTRALERHSVCQGLGDATYYVGRETFVAGHGGKMMPTAERLFAFLWRNATSAVDHFGLPPERVIEFGTRIDL
ncbi:MAG: KUP/HAK/KT family potassium transporter [Polyangiaceae bacterium]